MSEVDAARKASAKAADWLGRRDDAIRAALTAGFSAREIGRACGLSHVAVLKIGAR